MSQCNCFINQTKVNRKACLAEAGKLTLLDQTGSILIIQNNPSLYKRVYFM